MAQRNTAFIVPVHNRWDLVRPMLDSLEATVDLSNGAEVIVVDDCSQSETRTAVAALKPPYRTILNEENLGFAGSVNRAVEIANAEFIMLLNSDLVLRPGWFEPMFEVLKDDESVFCVGNLQYAMSDGRLDHSGIVFWQGGYPVHVDQRLEFIQNKQARLYPGVTAACCLYRRDRFLEFGGFDTLYRNGFEDIDLCLRARTRGLKSVVATTSEVGHHVASSPGRHDAEDANKTNFIIRWQPLTAVLEKDEEERVVLEKNGAQPSKRQPEPAPPYRVLVDLARMLPKGGSGGVVVFVKKLIETVHRLAPGKFRFLVLVQPTCAAEATRFAGNDDEIWVLPDEQDTEAPDDKRIQRLVHVDGSLPRSLMADLIFSPAGVTDLWIPDIPLVSVAVDTLHRDLPECLPVDEVRVREVWFDRMMNYSHTVLCISEWVADQVGKHFPVSKNRNVVTRAAVSAQTETAANSDRGPKPTQFLYPANAWPHKNHETLLVAYRLYRRSVGDAAWDLVLTGSHDEGMQRIEKLADVLGISESVRIKGYLPAPEFADLIMRTGALVFPSLYEGFGIPVLEAMHRGIPVIAGRNGSIPEVAGNACLFTDVRNPEALADAMVRMHTDPALRSKLSAAGRERASTFDFESEAKKVIAAFETAISDFARAGITWDPFRS